MREFVSNLPDGLYTQVTGTESFSAGYRQLICFARVMLRDSKVIIMDEVTDQHDDYYCYAEG